MPVKYECKKCNTRFVEWGAEKNEFKCPYCPRESLFRVGAAAEEAAPSLKRKKPAKKAAAKKTEPVIEMDGIDTDLETDTAEPEITEDGLVVVKEKNGDVLSDDDDEEPELDFEGDSTGTPTFDD